MTVLTGAAAIGIVLRPAKPRPDVMVWAFSDHHKQVLQLAAEDKENAAGPRIGIETVLNRSLSIRLQSMFMSGRSDDGVPDVVLLESSITGMLLRPPDTGIGLLPLDDYLDTRGERLIASTDAPGSAGWVARCVADGAAWTHDGTRWQPTPAARTDRWRQRLPAARLAYWSKNGRCYGIPYDIHPTGLAYRDDLWRQAGIDMEAIRTWDEFQDAAVRFEAFWRERGEAKRYACEVKPITADWMVNLLLQRGVVLVDDAGLHLTDARVVDTVARYATWITGPRAFGRQAAGDTGQMTGELIDGKLCAFLAPDWRIGLIEKNDTQRKLTGKLRVRALPVFADGDAPTTTFGGAMLAIMRTCHRPDDAWAAIERMLLSDAAMAARAKMTPRILPAAPERWADPRYQQDDPYFGASKPMALFAQLAPLVPARRSHPAQGLAEAVLADALHIAKAHLADHGTDGLADAVRAALTTGEAEARQRIAHGLFEPVAAAPAGRRP